MLKKFYKVLLLAPNGDPLQTWTISDERCEEYASHHDTDEDASAAVNHAIDPLTDFSPNEVSAQLNLGHVHNAVGLGHFFYSDPLSVGGFYKRFGDITAGTGGVRDILANLAVVMEHLGDWGDNNFDQTCANICEALFHSDEATIQKLIDRDSELMQQIVKRCLA